MRIGTWNLRLCPTSESATGLALASWMRGQAADIWLLTEVHQDWSPTHGRLLVSPPRSAGKEWKRWAGIETALPVKEQVCGDSSDHAGEEGLCLARLEV